MAEGQVDRLGLRIPKMERSKDKIKIKDLEKPSTLVLSKNIEK